MLKTPMSSFHLPHHLRANRKRLALSQDDVAFLLGATDGAKVSKYEHFNRVPTLETALACEVIMKRSASELFGGMYRNEERKVADRAQILLKRVEHLCSKQSTEKRRVLEDLANIEN